MSRIPALVAIGVLSMAQPVAASYHQSLVAPTGAVDFRATPHRSHLRCEDVQVDQFGASEVTRKVMPKSAAAPEHCRIEGMLPTRIGFQLNLPTSWNGRLYMHGNGGYAGEDPETYSYVRDHALSSGFATVWNDTGHRKAGSPDRSPSSMGAEFALDPVALSNHAYRSVHDTIVFAKQVVPTVYGSPVTYTYWNGCSTGGRQGVMSAYRFPNDFDGILAAAPTLDWSSIMIKGLWRQSVSERTGLTYAKLGSVFEAVMAKCDALDGLKDGLIDEPRRCNFNPRRDVKSCSAGADAATCLTPAQADALKALYDGPPKGPAMPEWVRDYPGLEHTSTASPWMLPGGDREGMAAVSQLRERNLLAVMAEAWMRYFGVKDPNYDARTFDFVRDPIRARTADEEMNPKPELEAFRKAGGKMITWWGWGDTALNPTMGIDFYDRVVARHGLEETKQFYRLFMVPGVAHCTGGYGPDMIDAMPLLIDWVEKGIAPERLPARKLVENKVVYNRAYCAYPALTRYKGKGDTEDPRNYTCVTPRASAAN